MPSPRLPSRPSDTWECGFLLDKAREVRSVSSRGGLVVAGGSDLYLLRPGAQTMATRPPPLDIGPVFVASAEPRAPFRYAFASDELVAVFYKTKEGDQIVRLRCSPSGPTATHLAWGRVNGATALHIRWDDGAVVRVKQDMSDLEALDLPSIDAIASDDAGALAMVSFDPDAPRAYVTRDGETFEFRPLPDGVSPTEDIYLAVADKAVAVAVGKSGAFVSRSREEAFERCEALNTAGPLAFEGSSSDAALFGAISAGEIASIVRIDRGGAAIRIAEFGGDGGVVPEITSLAWDAQRHQVWGASPEMGLVTCTAPSAKRGKKGSLS